MPENQMGQIMQEFVKTFKKLLTVRDGKMLDN